MRSSFPVRFKILVLILPWLLCLPLPLAAEESGEDYARSLLNQMSEASRTLNYDGVFIYQRGGSTNALRLIHKAGSEGGAERLVSLTGAAREVIRNKEEVTCFFPDDQAVMVEKSKPRELFATQLPRIMDKLLDNYHIQIKGSDRVAGRNAWVVGIQPRDAFRYGYQFWIDKENTLLLKSELRNRTGLLIEQIMFTQLAVLDAVPENLLQPSISGKGYTWHNNSENSELAAAQHAGWQVGWMPNGFSQNNQEIVPSTKGKTQVRHLIYSDGLAMVSIFIEKLENSRGLSTGLSRMGGVNAYARVANGYQVTAVGEVPQATVQRMANSVSMDQ